MGSGRTFLIAAIAAVALGVGLGLEPSLLPPDDGLWVAGLLLVLGVAFGLRAIALPFLVCVPWGLVTFATSKCVYECAGWFVLASIFPLFLCIPVLAGAAARAAVRWSRRRGPLSDEG